MDVILYDKLRDIFRKIFDAEAELESILGGPHATMPVASVTKKIESALGGGDRKPCGCAKRGRSKSSCHVCNPTVGDFVNEEADAEPDAPQDIVCECGGVKRHRKNCSHKDAPLATYADEQLQPFKKYKCIACDKTVETRQHRLDLVCGAPCYGKIFVETL